jgi:hypothetical protein
MEDSSMPQANKRSNTNSRSGSAHASADAKTLIAAHRKAKARVCAARVSLEAISYPTRVLVIVEEIGPQAAAYDQEHLSRLADEHISRRGLVGLPRISFMKEIEGYGHALATLTSLHEGWRDRHGIDAIEAEDGAAHAAENLAGMALIARIKAHPRDVAEIAKYFGSEEMATGNYWRQRQVLRAIATVRGRA